MYLLNYHKKLTGIPLWLFASECSWMIIYGENVILELVSVHKSDNYFISYNILKPDKINGLLIRLISRSIISAT